MNNLQTIYRTIFLNYCKYVKNYKSAAIVNQIGLIKNTSFKLKYYYKKFPCNFVYFELKILKMN